MNSIKKTVEAHSQKAQGLPRSAWNFNSDRLFYQCLIAMALTLVAERREPSGESLKNKAETVGLAPLRYNADSKVSTIRV